MALIRKKKELPSFSEEDFEDEYAYRETEKWKKIYNTYLNSKSVMKATGKRAEETYLKMVDKIYFNGDINQKNILASWKTFKKD